MPTKLKRLQVVLTPNEQQSLEGIAASKNLDAAEVIRDALRQVYPEFPHETQPRAIHGKRKGANAKREPKA